MSAVWSCCALLLAPKRDLILWHLRRFAPGCETRTSLGGNQGSLCAASPGAQITHTFSPAGRAGSTQEPYRSAGPLTGRPAAHGGTGRAFLQGTAPARFRHLKMNFFLTSGSCNIGKGKEYIQRPEFQLHLAVWPWTSHWTLLTLIIY